MIAEIIALFQKWRDKVPYTIVEDTPESRIAAILAPRHSFIRTQPTQAEIKAQFDLHGGCDPIANIGLIAKTQALYPEYAQYEQKTTTGMFDDVHLDEDGVVKNDRSIALRAMFCNAGYDRYLPERFRADAEIILCRVISSNFSFWGTESYLDPSKYAFITERLKSGEAYTDEGAPEIEMLYAIVKAERPIKEFYERIRPKLRMISLELDLRERENYEIVSKLPNFESVMNECVEHESDKIKSNFKKLMPTFLAGKLENALPDKPPTKTKLIKI